MKKRIMNMFMFGLLATAVALTSCDDDNNGNGGGGEEFDEDRWITVAGALMQDSEGDGNGGTRVYSISKENARNSEYAVSVYDNGFAVVSNRTARLQSSEDGNNLFNIAYTGDNGGEFSKYTVNGGNDFVQGDALVSIAAYAGTSPRWVKLFDGDKTGIAVNVTTPTVNNATNGEAYQYYRGTATVLSLSLQGEGITNYKQYQIPLSTAEELEGHCIFRLDAPVLNKAGDKLIIGTWMRKYDPSTGKTESAFTRLGTKSVVVDYPSLENPTVITSTVGHGDCSGYRSFNSFLADDGCIYQATQRESDGVGSYILKITESNQYDNSYVFSLDAALGVTDSYVECWRYAGNGKAIVLYRHGDSDMSYVAYLDLTAKTAKTLTDIPADDSLSFSQYQGILVSGNEVFLAVTPTGKDGNIYIINSTTGEVTKGAKLVNKSGNHYIGIF